LPRQQDREFLTAEAPDDIAAAQARAHRVGKHLQHGVAGKMSEAVVDVLERVEIQKKDRCRGMLVMRKQRLALFDEGAACQQLRQRIRAGRVPIASLDALPVQRENVEAHHGDEDRR
jgi:hypothetical protein